MAERRMFAKAITGSSRFLQLPATSRLLYYDLGQEADDDGCCETYGVMRKTGASEDDLRLLVSKGFVRILNDDLVVHIVHWAINNHIRKDRYHPGIYKTLINPAHSIALDSGNQMTTEDSIDQVSTGEVSTGEVSTGEVRPAELINSNSITTCPNFEPPTLDEVRAYCMERQNDIDPQHFVDYYTTTGWMVGRTKMQDWQAAIRVWERNDTHNNERQTGSSGNPFLGMTGVDYE